VRTLGAARWLIILGVLCLACGAGGTIALAAAGHPARHRSARACHRPKHRRCPTTHARNRLSPKDRRRLASRSLKPRGAAKRSGSTSPWTTVPSAVGPGSTPGSSTAPSGSGGTPPGESPTPPPAPARVQVTAEDSEAFRFTLSRPSVPAGKVIIEFLNHGQDAHNLNAIEPIEASVAGSIPDTAPNGHPSLTVNLRHGSYTLFCSLKEHEAKGMKATLIVN
jgi:plastocyanin